MAKYCSPSTIVGPMEVARPGRLHFHRQARKPENNAAVHERVVAARKRQVQRAGVPNAQLDSAGVRKNCKPDGRNHQFLEDAAEQMGLSPRACQRVLKVARTLADLENMDNFANRHLAEALAYRGFDCGENRG